MSLYRLISLRSAPAEKALPLPVMTIALMSLSYSTALQAFIISFLIVVLTAFMTSGRLSVIFNHPGFLSTMIALYFVRAFLSCLYQDWLKSSSKVFKDR